MIRISPRHACRFLLLAALAGTSLVASAADRRFVPVPATEYQKLQVINGATIISAAGKTFHAGASLAPTSSRRAWLSVSVKNTGTAPLPFNDAGILARSGNATLGMELAGEAVTPAEAVLAPGVLVTRQFQLELPKRSKTSLAKLKVSVRMEGETIEFDFDELN